MITTENLIRYFETLTAADVERMGDYYSENATFSDPFNHVCGSRAIAAIFAHMFEQLDEPRFRITEHFESPGQLMLVWVMSCRLGDRAISVEGASHLHLDVGGRIKEHRDYWDAASGIYAHLPGIGLVMRYARQRLAAPGAPPV